MGEIILLDKDQILTSAMECARENSRETAMILEGSRTGKVIALEKSLNIQPYIMWQSEEKLKLEPHFLLGALRATQKSQIPFIFLHTHPNQKHLHFSELDKSFELDMMMLATQIEYQEPLVFLVSSADSTIARYYWHGTENYASIERTLDL